jgi:hypothetical protein
MKVWNEDFNFATSVKLAAGSEAVSALPCGSRVRRTCRAGDGSDPDLLVLLGEIAVGTSASVEVATKWGNNTGRAQSPDRGRDAGIVSFKTGGGISARLHE